MGEKKEEEKNERKFIIEYWKLFFFVRVCVCVCVSCTRQWAWCLSTSTRIYSNLKWKRRQQTVQFQFHRIMIFIYFGKNTGVGWKVFMLFFFHVQGRRNSLWSQLKCVWMVECRRTTPFYFQFISNFCFLFLFFQLFENLFSINSLFWNVVERNWSLCSQVAGFLFFWQSIDNKRAKDIHYSIKWQ